MTTLPVATVASPLPRLLVVDDQAIHIQVLHQLFAHECRVFVATSGARALEICQEDPPDLVLLDVVMPGLDGFEVCRRLKANPVTWDVPVIFLTASSNPDEETLGLELGAVDFISKPINPAVVRARVRTQLTLKRQTDSIRQLAFLDGLTGVCNRRQFDQQLPIELARAQRSRQPLLLAMVDIDHFKPFNDRYGHQAGDDCLRAVSQCLKAGFRRPADLFARYGGEEFVCVLPETPFDPGLALLREQEQRVRALAIPNAGSVVAGCVTVSIGVAGWEPGDPPDPARLLRRADEALYEAKRAGRGRVCAAAAEGAAA
ncbi:diguanylate cyclase [Ramlibacter sp. MAHUQ-53]|uniref:diguanylate cyclase n=1 Tax=unclassified Ramlibacter TaxID=2617605 RepID=UPI00363CE461